MLHSSFLSSRLHLLSIMVILFTLLFTLSACAPKTEVRGNLPSPSKLAKITIGESTIDQVVEHIGTPSLVATFDSYTWFYISTKREGYAFFEKDITHHSVLELKFGQDRILSHMKEYKAEDLKKISYLSRETPTSGREFTLWEQLFGNLGAKPVDSGR